MELLPDVNCDIPFEHSSTFVSTMKARSLLSKVGGSNDQNVGCDCLRACQVEQCILQDSNQDESEEFDRVKRGRMCGKHCQ